MSFRRMPESMSVDRFRVTARDDVIYEICWTLIGIDRVDVDTPAYLARFLQLVESGQGGAQ